MQTSAPLRIRNLQRVRICAPHRRPRLDSIRFPACSRDTDAPPYAIPNQTRSREKTEGPTISRQALAVLVGRVGIEPTTNGLRVQDTRARARRKPMKRNGRFAGTRTAAPRPNLCRTKSRPCWSGAALFKPRQRLSAVAAEPFPNVRRVGATRHQQARAPSIREPRVGVRSPLATRCSRSGS